MSLTSDSQGVYHDLDYLILIQINVSFEPSPSNYFRGHQNLKNAKHQRPLISVDLRTVSASANHGYHFVIPVNVQCAYHQQKCQNLHVVGIGMLQNTT